MFRVSLNTSNMIASERPLVNRLTCPSLGCINAAVPSAGAGETGDKNRAILHANSILNVKKIFAYSATIICLICGFCRRFFPFLPYMTIFCYLPQNLLVQLSVIFVHNFFCSY